MASNIGTNPQDIPLNGFLGQQAFLDQPAPKPFALIHHITNDSSASRGSQSAKFDGTIRTMNCRNVRYDNYGAYNPDTGIYTVPKKGIYCVGVSGNIGIDGTVNTLQMYLYQNSTFIVRAYMDESLRFGSWVFQDIQLYSPMCEIGDELTLRGQVGGGGNAWFDDDGNYTQQFFFMVS